MPSLPSDDPGVLSVKEVHAEFEKLLAGSSPHGIAKSHR